MKFTISLTLILVILSSCTLKQKDKESVTGTFENITLIPVVDSLLSNFITRSIVDNQNLDYYLITYVSNDDRIITLIATDSGIKFFNRYRPLFHINKLARKVFVINGSEDIFNITFKQEILDIKKVGNFWTFKSYILKEGTIITIPQGIPPFSPPPETIEDSGQKK